MMRASEPLGEAHQGAHRRRVRGGVEARPIGEQGTNDRFAPRSGLSRFRPIPTHDPRNGRSRRS